MWAPRGYYEPRRRRGYYYDPWLDRFSVLYLLLPLLREAQERLTAAATPVTLALLALQLALHYRAALLPGLEALLPHAPLRDVCINPARWWQLRRLALAPLLHVDDLHLYYNMISLISKGAALEPTLGSQHFAALVAGLGAAAGAIHLALAHALHALGADPYGNALHSCAVGFSAVLFALKVVTTWNARGTGDVAGIRLPMRWLSWGELLLIQLVAPETSFLGHLAGILAGIAYVAPALHGMRARARRLARRARAAVEWALRPPAPAPERRAHAPPPAPRGPAPAVLTAEELRALHVARFAATQRPQPRRPRAASPPPQRSGR